MLKKTAVAISVAALAATTIALPAAAGLEKPVQLASCNPCKASGGCNPCGANAACNPCGAKKGCNPCGGSKSYNPYARPAANPCAAKKSCQPKSKWK